MPLEKQGVLLKLTWPNSKVTTRKGELTWIGHLRPTDVSPEYTIQLRYRTGQRPTVAVLDPPLDVEHRGHLPHVYADDDLCLYTAGDWNSAMPISATIIPWASEWLFHYEAWLVTGVWQGGGAPYFASKHPPGGAEGDDGNSNNRPLHRS